MRVVVQRVLRASVRDAGAPPATAASIGRGAVLLAGFRRTDDDAVIDWMAAKCLGLRIFPRADGALDRTLADCSGALLVVPNFTLYGDASRGRRPSFTEAAPPEFAAVRFERFLAVLRRGPVPVESGSFRTHMHLELVNDGPVTLWLER